jgi:hypothetical protein
VKVETGNCMFVVKYADETVPEWKRETDLTMELYKKGMNTARQAGDNYAFDELQSAYEDLLY